MDSTLTVSSNPLDLRTLNGEKSLASNQLGGQWGGTYPLNDGLMMKEQESLPPSAAIFGGNDFLLRCVDWTMADVDAGKFGTSTSRSTSGNGNSMGGMNLSDPFYTQTASAPPQKLVTRQYQQQLARRDGYRHQPILRPSIAKGQTDSSQEARLPTQDSTGCRLRERGWRQQYEDQPPNQDEKRS